MITKRLLLPTDTSPDDTRSTPRPFVFVANGPPTVPSRAHFFSSSRLLSRGLRRDSVSHRPLFSPVGSFRRWRRLLPLLLLLLHLHLLLSPLHLITSY